MSHVCPQCGRIAFKTYQEYEYHKRVVHGLRVKIMPENVTGRTVKQIVAEAEETWLAPHLVVPDRKQLVITTNNETEHLAACNCRTCINSRLDAIIAASEKSLETLQNSVILEHEQE